MAMTDPLGDMLTRIRNAQMRRMLVVRVPASKLRGHVLEVLKDEGFIRGYDREEDERNKAFFNVELKYHEGEPVINRIARVSTPGRRVYSGVNDLPMIANGLGITIVSTPKGVMSDNAARAANVGGEVLCEVF
ncbi:MAG: 30S ribosomal protein S8 [Alphaproteobacteria bacterium]|nr:30S ribosomal protein S8 [Alphaproteobacteria bacterium]